MKYAGLLAVYGLIFGIIVFFNIGNIVDWYQENRHRKSFAGALTRVAGFVFYLFYWPLKIIVHLISNVGGILFIIGIPIMFVVLIVDAWNERAWVALIFVSVIALVGISILGFKIYYTLEDKIQKHLARNDKDDKSKETHND